MLTEMYIKQLLLSLKYSKYLIYFKYFEWTSLVKVFKKMIETNLNPFYLFLLF